MSKLEKRLIILAILFVICYTGAIALSIHARINKSDDTVRLESDALTPAESRLLLVELFLPMLILLTLAICFVIVRKQRARQIERLEASDDQAEPDADQHGE
jgi:hypothetical protein